MTAAKRSDPAAAGESVAAAAKGMRLAVLEDDANQSTMLVTWLTEAGHACHAFSTGKALVHALGRESYDLLLVDWQVPQMNGPQVLDWVRNNLGSVVPVIFVTAQDSEGAIVQALASGADDYLVKPVRRLELLARVGALLRRSHGLLARAETLVVPPYRIDCNARRIELHAMPVELTEKEFELAVFLFRELGQVLSRGHILECVWGRNAGVLTRTVDTHMSRLRTKLRIGQENGLRLTSVYNYGYRLEKAGD